MTTNAERQTAYLEKLRAAGGNRTTFDLSAEALQAMRKIVKRDKLASRNEAVTAALIEFARTRK